MVVAARLGFPRGLLSHNALIAFDADHKLPHRILLNYSSLIEKNHHQATGREPEYSITPRSQIGQANRAYRAASRCNT